jgi:hypothetical protein
MSNFSLLTFNEDAENLTMNELADEYMPVALIERLEEWDLPEAEAFAQALWQGQPIDELEAIAKRQLTEAQIVEVHEQMQRIKADTEPCEHDGLTIENSIDWRHGDQEMMNLLRDGAPFFMRLKLLDMQRCSCAEADVLVPFLALRVANTPVALVTTDLAAMRADPTGRYVLRYRDMIWAWPMSSFEEGLADRFLVTGTSVWLKPEDVDQFWRVVPIT